MLEEKTTVRMHRALLLWTALLGLASGVAGAAQAADYLSGYSGGSSYTSGRYMSGYSSGSGSSGRYLSGYSRSSYSNGGYYGGHGSGHSYSNPGPYYNKNISRSTGSSSGGEKRYYYRAYATGGNYPFSFFRRGNDSRNGYSGPNTTISNPHRSDWEAYLLRLQRQANQRAANDNSDLCGNYLRAPAACRTTTTRYDPVRYVEVKYIPEVDGAYR